MLKSKWFPVLPVMFSLFLTGCQTEPQTENLISQSLMIPETVRYETVLAERADLLRNATVEQKKQVVYPLGEVLCWDTENSRLEEIKVKSGTVSEDTQLATFSVDTSKADLAELQLRLQRQQGQFEEEEARRSKEMAAAQAELVGLSGYERKIAELELEKLQASYDQFCYQAKRSLNAIQEQLEVLQSATKKTDLRAPDAGQITLEAEDLNAGDYVNPGTAMYYFQYHKIWYVKVGKEIPYNSQVQFWSRNDYEKFYPDQIEKIKPVYTGTVVTSADILPGEYQQDTWVRMDTPCTPDDLKDTVLYLPGERIQGLLTAPGALRTEGDKRYVQVLEDGVIKKRYVIWGPGETVIDGLTEGQMLILD